MNKTLHRMLTLFAEMHSATQQKAGPDGIPMSAVHHYEAQRRDSIHYLQDLIEALREGGPGPQVLRQPVTDDTFIVSPRV